MYDWVGEVWVIHRQLTAPVTVVAITSWDTHRLGLGRLVDDAHAALAAGAMNHLLGPRYGTRSSCRNASPNHHPIATTPPTVQPLCS